MGVLPDWMIQRDVKITPLDDGRHKPGKISSGLTSYGYDARLGYKFDVFKAYPCDEVDPKNFNRRMMENVDLTPPSHTISSDGFCTTCGGTAFPGPDQIEEPFGFCPTFVKPNFLRIPPHSFALGESVETFQIPRDTLVLCVGKSTYARCGIIVNVTPGEPEWVGKWTIEISNTTPLPARVYCGEGIMQCIFIRTDGHAEATMDAVRRLVGQHAQERVFKPMADKRNELALAEEQFMAALGNGTCRVSYADKKGKYQHQTGLTAPFVK
jgi:dCTP deaminase